MRKVFKICGVICAVVALLSLSVFTVGASSNEVFNLRTFEVFEGTSTVDAEWVEKSAAWDAKQGLLHQTDTSIQQYFGWYGWRAEFYTFPYVKVTEGQYFLFTVSLSSLMPDYATSAGGVLPEGLYLTCKVTNSDGIVYELEPYLELDASGSYTCTFAAQIGDGEAFSFGDVLFESNLCPETVKDPYEIYMTFSVQAKLTPEQQRHEELLENIDANTDKITNGWGTDDDTAGDTDSAVGDLGNAENEALGGKSDEEIQEEINSALSSDSLPDPELDNVIIVGGTYEKLLNAFGAEYQSLLILALTLGLAAFLVGRQYSAKGG